MSLIDLRPLERDREVLRRLEDLERMLHVHDARHAGQIALVQRIGRRAIREIVPLLLARRGQIRNFAAVDDARARPACRASRRGARGRRPRDCAPARCLADRFAVGCAERCATRCRDECSERERAQHQTLRRFAASILNTRGSRTRSAALKVSCDTASAALAVRASTRRRPSPRCPS